MNGPRRDDEGHSFFSYQILIYKKLYFMVNKFHINPQHRENEFIIDPVTGERVYKDCSIAVSILVYAEKDGDFYVPCHIRGPKCPDEVGKISLVCGYKDHGEHLPEAAWREYYQETGVRLPIRSIKLIGINDPVGDGKENVTIRYAAKVSYEDLMRVKPTTDSKARGGEDGEVERHMMRKITKENAEKLLEEDSKWAFGHNRLIYNYLILGQYEWTTMKV